MRFWIDALDLHGVLALLFTRFRIRSKQSDLNRFGLLWHIVSKCSVCRTWTCDCCAGEEPADGKDAE